MRSNTLSRAARARSGKRSGRNRDGAWGNTTNKAASAAVNRLGSLPNQASDAARTPSRLPP